MSRLSATHRGRPVTLMYDFRRMTPAERWEILCQPWARGLPVHAPPHLSGVAGEYLITSETLRIAHSRVAPAMNFQPGQDGRRVWYRYSAPRSQ